MNIPNPYKDPNPLVEWFLDLPIYFRIALVIAAVLYISLLAACFSSGPGGITTLFAIHIVLAIVYVIFATIAWFINRD